MSAFKARVLRAGLLAGLLLSASLQAAETTDTRLDQLGDEIEENTTEGS